MTSNFYLMTLHQCVINTQVEQLITVFSFKQLASNGLTENTSSIEQSSTDDTNEFAPAAKK